jgi:DNA repair protein RadC
VGPRINDWPSEERPRERLLEHGPAALADSELVALVLRTGDSSTGDTSLDQARRLLADLGGLAGLGRAAPAEVLRRKGVGAAKAAALAAAFEIGRRQAARRLENGAAFRTAADVFHHFRGRYAGLRKEVFSIFLLDAKHRKLREVRVSEGSLTASIVHPREVFAPAVRDSAAAVILVHNHPSGDPAPSPEDVELTRRLREAGDLLGIRVLDHVIVGAEKHFSFVEAGWW